MLALRLLLAALLLIGSTRPAAARAGALALLEPVHGNAIYKRLLERHWIANTGLFVSFPDSLDVKLAQQASTYEQAAMGLLALELKDTERTQALLEFYRAAWASQPRGFMNFYNADYGNAGIEKTVHAGPTAWIGLFAARAARRLNDARAAGLALDIAYWMSNSLPHSAGAVAMGAQDEPRGAPWTRIYSTENNASYYAFLSELLRWRELDSQLRARYTEERDAVGQWLAREMIDRRTWHVNRGRTPAGIDRVAALDAVTWTVSALGPKKLADLGVPPDRLMDAAAKRFEVRVGGITGVDPSDQVEADLVFIQDHAVKQQSRRPRNDDHRMIWFEGLGQYLIALGQTTAWLDGEDRSSEAASFREKMRELCDAFDAAALAQVEGDAAWPYATDGRFFRDGWRTPAPSADGPASSLISGVWRLFAGMGINPLTGEPVARIERVSLERPTQVTPIARNVGPYYGTSEEMTSRAWAHFNAGRLAEAVRQAEATVSEWGGWAAKLQRRKEQEAGRLLPFTGEPGEKQAIFAYWALNDVAACWYIIGRAKDQQHHYAEAGTAFREIMENYSLAQVWDPQGWFWSPAEAVNQEFVQRDPKHYAGVLPGEPAAG